jgi:UDP-N-acetylmuramoyl-L-alanyl-D-glutamate--2,6-diaminopimelate ligase
MNVAADSPWGPDGSREKCASMKLRDIAGNAFPELEGTAGRAGWRAGDFRPFFRQPQDCARHGVRRRCRHQGRRRGLRGRCRRARRCRCHRLACRRCVHSCSRGQEPRRFLSIAASNFYGKQPETMVAVTGTAGKTSVASFTRQIWAHAGHPAAMIGTTGVVSPTPQRLWLADHAGSGFAA